MIETKFQMKTCKKKKNLNENGKKSIKKQCKKI